jgi:hypothetical protein
MITAAPRRAQAPNPLFRKQHGFREAKVYTVPAKKIIIIINNFYQEA